jgi:hypothetical protein
MKKDDDLCRTCGTADTCAYLVKNMKEKGLYVDWKIMLKRILKKYTVRVMCSVIWLTGGTTADCTELLSEFSDSVNGRDGD